MSYNDLTQSGISKVMFSYDIDIQSWGFAFTVDNLKQCVAIYLQILCFSGGVSIRKFK